MYTMTTLITKIGIENDNSYLLTINKSLETDHVERKVPKYKNHKLRERKVKTFLCNLYFGTFCST